MPPFAHFVDLIFCERNAWATTYMEMLTLIKDSDFALLRSLGGVLINALLLYAIRRFSRACLGTYKYLLAVFATFDIFLSTAHAVASPIAVIVNATFGVVTSTFENSQITSLYCACFTIPFALMNIHFLYRFWSIRYPHLILLFSTKKFVAFIALLPIVDCVVWYRLTLWVTSLDVDGMGLAQLCDEFAKRYGHTIRDGWIVLTFRTGGGLNIGVLSGLLFLDSIMLIFFSIAVTLAALTYHYIARAETISAQARSLQHKLLVALCAQTAVPLVFVYIPYGIVGNMAVFRVPAYSLDRVCMQLTACFPVWDALIIIGLIRDYREGIVEMFKKGIVAEPTWKGVQSTAAVSSITPVQ